MRTKAEAIANPMAGDAWKSKTGSIRNIWKIEDRYSGDWAIVYFRGTRDGSVHLSTFRRWATNAEFLGGAE